MGDLAVPATDAPAPRLPDAQEAFVLQTIATHAESLLRTARRHSLCADDAHDAYQRALEIFMRRAATLDPARAGRWLHVVVKHEAMEVRRRRSELVAFEDLDYERHTAIDAADPAERALSADRTAQAAEALRRLKPQELRAIWLKALGHSYAEISEATGFSPTKVNRCLAEGRKAFMERYAGIASGQECDRWQPVLSAMVDGEATAVQIADLRPHLRNCPRCRATLKGLREVERPLALVLPVGLMGAGLKLGGLLERLVPAAGAGDAAGGAGGVGVLTAGGAKLAALLAAGAAATAGGGLVAAQADHVAQHDHRHRPVPAAHAPASSAAVRTARTAIVTASSRAARAAPTARAAPAQAASTSAAPKLVAHRSSHPSRIEFAPAGGEVATAPTLTSAPAHAATAAAPTPHPTTSPSAAADASRGEFAPQP